MHTAKSIAFCSLLVVVSAISGSLGQDLQTFNESQIEQFFAVDGRVGWGPLWIGMPLAEVESQFGRRAGWSSSSSCMGSTYRIPGVSDRVSVGFLPSEAGPTVAWISVGMESQIPNEVELETLVGWLRVLHGAVAERVHGLLYRPRVTLDTEAQDHAPSYEIANHHQVHLNVISDWITMSHDRLRVEDFLSVRSD